MARHQMWIEPETMARIIGIQDARIKELEDKLMLSNSLCEIYRKEAKELKAEAVDVDELNAELDAIVQE